MNRNFRARLWQFAILAMHAFLLSGCQSDDHSVAAGMTRFTLQHGGEQREYFVFLPSRYGGEEILPLAVFMHGYGGTATGTEAEVTNGLNRYAEAFGYIMVYPQGTWFVSGGALDKQWLVSSWNHISDGFDKGPDGPICAADAGEFPCPPECGSCGACGWTSCYDDVGFLKVLLKTIAQDFVTDESRHFIAGFSNGAMMANRFACEASETLAAVALIGGRVEPGFECTPSIPLPLLQINGGRDNAVPHDGRISSDGYFYAATESIERHWLDGNECAANEENWFAAGLGSETLDCTIACGRSRFPSIDCVWPEGDHRWPGTPGTRGSNGYCVSALQAKSMPQQTLCMEPDPTIDVWGSRLLFEFFDRH